MKKGVVAVRLGIFVLIDGFIERERALPFSPATPAARSR